MASKTNRVEVPEAKAAMDRFKTEVASELGVNLKEGYNGDLTSKEAGRDRKSTRLNSSHTDSSRMPSSA